MRNAILKEYNKLKRAIFSIQRKGMSFVDIYNHLGGHNICQEYFDVSLDHGTYTVIKDGNSVRLSDTIEYYPSGSAFSTTNYNKLKRRNKKYLKK